MNEKLKPCPCCGGEARYFDKKRSIFGFDIIFDFSICCIKCGLQLANDRYKVEVEMGADGEFIVKNDDRKKAAEDWNRRDKDEVEECEKDKAGKREIRAGYCERKIKTDFVSECAGDSGILR